MEERLETKLQEKPGILILQIDRKLKGQITEEANRLGISASSFMRLLASQYFDGITFERKIQTSNPSIEK